MKNKLLLITAICVLSVTQSFGASSYFTVNPNPNQNPNDKGWGLYEITVSEGERSCSAVGASFDCCSGSFLKRPNLDPSRIDSYTNGMEWRTGANAKICQKLMCEFLKDTRANGGKKCSDYQ